MANDRMPEDFTRRHDLFADAGFADPDRALESLVGDAQAIGLLTDSAEATSAVDLESSLTRGGHLAMEHLAAANAPVLDAAVEWLFERGGDLSTLLWLARRLGGAHFHLGALVFGLGHRFVVAGRHREAAGLMRFLVNVDFDFGRLYAEPGLAYGFFRSRDPNPFVWKILHHVAERAARFPERDQRVGILELGSGIGNDALGFLASPLVTSYVGTDLSAEALAKLEERGRTIQSRRPDLRITTTAGSFVEYLIALAGTRAHGVDLVYSYSSLHYFSSRELDEIFHRVKLLLEPERGLFAFAIKGEGSIWDGQGVPLYRPDVWINFDGQSRWFPSRAAIVALTDRMGYEIRMHESAEHWGYSEQGEKDIFHYVICSPRR